MKRTTQTALKSHGLVMMDRAVTAKFGIRCETKLNPATKQFETETYGEPPMEVLAFIAGYQKALSDMFIAARV